MQELRLIIYLRVMGLLIGGVWIFHGLYSKILDGIPRHQSIVARILGDSLAEIATISIGAMEVLLGCWAIWGRHRMLNASIQTLALVSMNTIEILFARDLLISPSGMVILNFMFLLFVWSWAIHEDYPNSSN